MTTVIRIVNLSTNLVAIPAFTGVIDSLEDRTVTQETTLADAFSLSGTAALGVAAFIDGTAVDPECLVQESSRVLVAGDLTDGARNLVLVSAVGGASVLELPLTTTLTAGTEIWVYATDVTNALSVTHNVADTILTEAEAVALTTVGSVLRLQNDGISDWVASGDSVLGPPSTPSPEIALNGFFLGHSLLNFEMPFMVQRFVDATDDVSLTYDITVGPGANIQFQWNNPASGGGDNPSIFLQAGPYDVLVLTEATPIADQIVGADSAVNALNFMGLAYAENAAVQTYFYEVWDDNVLGLPAWRHTVDENRMVYEEIFGDINTGFAGSDARIIPGGQAIGALYDAALAAEIPSFDQNDIFVDTAGHLTDTGNYFIACVFFATLYQQTPVGVPATILDVSGGAFDAIAGPTAEALQVLAWRVVQADLLSGVTASAGVPTVVTRVPSIRATGIALDSTVVVTFSEAMDPATITTATVYLVAAGSVVAASVIYAGVEATITPDADLTDNTAYTVVVTTGAETASDNTAVGVNSVWTFETIMPPPELNTTSPTQGQIGASRFVGVTLFYFQDIDASTVDDTTFIITETAGGTPISGSRVVTGSTLAFTPDVAFDALTEYRVQLLAVVEGEPPRGPVVPLDFLFTTS